MSKADKMFKKLGFEKYLLINKRKQTWGEKWINNRSLTMVTFDYIDKEICCSTTEFNAEPIYIGINILQAINIRCKELEWLDE